MSVELSFPPVATTARPNAGPAAELVHVALAACRELFGADAVELVSSEPGITFGPIGPRVARDPRVVHTAHLPIGGIAVGVLKLSNPGGGRALSNSEILLLGGIARDLGQALERLQAEASAENVFRREGDFWTVAHAGALVHVRDAKGMRVLARLLESPGREIHALELESAAHAGLTALEGRDPVLDERSRRAIRTRLAELEDELEDAVARNDLGRGERARTESEFLRDELRRCTGLNGCTRVAASAAERARQNVTRALRGAIKRISDHHGALARHFDRTVRTGVFCCYAPDPRLPIRWQI